MKKETVKEKIAKLGEEFKGFAFKEATLGAAVGIILGSAIKAMIDSLVKDILTPPIGQLTSGLDFSNLFITLGKTQYESLELAREAGAAVITYGNFINATISFLITATVLFIIVYQGSKFTKKFQKKELKEEKATTKVCSFCKSDIHLEATKCPFCTSTVK